MTPEPMPDEIERHIADQLDRRFRAALDEATGVYGDGEPRRIGTLAPAPDSEIPRPTYTDTRLILAVYIDQHGQYQVSPHGSEEEIETATGKALRSLAFGLLNTVARANTP